MSDILARILADKRIEVERAKLERPLAVVRAAARAMPPPRDFHAALRQPGIRVIAECKRQSPSKGVMVENYDPVKIARSYEAGGAAAISVLTDQKYFGGILDHLTAVSKAVRIPVLRKDFVIDEYQVYEARAAGADTFLLLAGPLNAQSLTQLSEIGRKLGMEPLVESHTDAELEQALKGGGQILGINNRNLKDFSVDLERSRTLLAKIGDKTAVCESGIKSRADIEIMSAVGYKVFLIGEALVTHPDPQAALQDLTRDKA